MIPLCSCHYSFPRSTPAPGSALRLLVQAARTPWLWQVQDPQMTDATTGCSHPVISLCLSIMQSWPNTRQVQVLSQGTTPIPSLESSPAARGALEAVGTSSGAQLLSRWFNPRKHVQVSSLTAAPVPQQGADGQRHHHSQCQGCCRTAEGRIQHLQPESNSR